MINFRDIPSENAKNLTVSNFQDIKKRLNQCKTIKDWKQLGRELCVEFSISKDESIDILHGLNIMIKTEGIFGQTDAELQQTIGC